MDNTLLLTYAARVLEPPENICMKAILFALLMMPFAVRSQKNAVCTIYLPQTIKTERLSIYYYNGKERKFMEVKSNNDSIVVRDTYYMKHLILFIGYQGTTPTNGCGAVFYIGDRAATIRLADTDSSQNIFYHMQVKNAVDARSLGFNQMYQYTSEERDRVIAAVNKIMASPANDALKDTARMLANIELKKKMDYIRKNGDQYYSFFTFGVEYINSRLFPVDTLISIFNRSFPPEYKNSIEGKQTLALLKTRKLREQERLAPDFSSKDIEGKTISLSQYKGKYVLINFWASWCAPCVKEFPELNKLTADIPEDKLVRIFINKDLDTTAFEKARIKYNLTGIHIYSNEELSTKYKASGIPQVYLIDKEGKIIYDRDDLLDYELAMLAEIIKKTPGLK
jgi:thiol-disulfide isomerase/thioredoxin